MTNLLRSDMQAHYNFIYDETIDDLSDLSLLSYQKLGKWLMGIVLQTLLSPGIYELYIYIYFFFYIVPKQKRQRLVRFGKEIW